MFNILQQNTSLVFIISLVLVLVLVLAPVNNLLSSNKSSVVRSLNVNNSEIFNEFFMLRVCIDFTTLISNQCYSRILQLR